MQIRVLAGFKRLMMVLAIASLIAASAHAATSISPTAPTAGAPTVRTACRKSTTPPESSSASCSSARTTSGRTPRVPSTEASARPDWNAAGVLHTQVGSFDLTKGLPNIPSELQAANRLATLPSQYFLLQVKPEAFTDGAFDQMRQQIAAGGGAIVGEMPVAAFAVRMTQAAVRRDLDRSFGRRARPLPAGIQALPRDRPHAAPAGREGRLERLLPRASALPRGEPGGRRGRAEGDGAQGHEDL